MYRPQTIFLVFKQETLKSHTYADYREYWFVSVPADAD